MNRKSIAKIISWNTDNEAVCASAARMSTTKGNANEIFENAKGSANNKDLIKRVLSSGHKSVVEHAVFSIAFWDVSAFVEQYLIEFRLASFTVKSRRYVDFRNQGYYIPPELEGEELSLYCQYMDELFAGYSLLLDMGVPKEDARFLLPYSFCSNFYCTLNARELVNLITSIQYGRGKSIPELQDLAGQLIEQISYIFPELLIEFAQTPRSVELKKESNWHFSNSSIRILEPNKIDKVELVQAPLDAMETVRLAHSALYPFCYDEFNIKDIITSLRPRELEQIHYTFTIHNMTLSGVTHLVRHRIQSIIVPSIEDVDHSTCIIPRVIENDPVAKKGYVKTLQHIDELARKASEGCILKHYGYYFSLSGNILNLITTMNARELMHFIRLRTCNRAQWEIRSVASDMLTILRKNCPELFMHYGPSCIITGTCPEGKMSCGKAKGIIPTRGDK